MSERENSWWVSVLFVFVGFQGCIQFAINKLTDHQIDRLQKQITELKDGKAGDSK